MQPTKFAHMDTVSHNGTVLTFAEEWSDEPTERRLWYRVLDLEQTADQDQEGAWEDATRWTRWYEIPWPEELRPVGLGLLTVRSTVDHSFATVAGRWKVVTDGAHIYVFRALSVAVTGDDAARVYANRYTLTREPSPDSGTNREAKGQDVTVPQLRPAREARYRRSAMRETPLGDTDTQGTRDLGNAAFVEPTMEWSMLRPVDGAFTVTLTPSDVPARQRWQFFCRWEQLVEIDDDEEVMEPAVAAFSILRDEDGWADLDEKYHQLNTTADPFHILPDRVFVLTHADHGTLAVKGRPDALTFRLQEQSSGGDGDDDDRAVSPQRAMLALRVAWKEAALDEDGNPEVDDQEQPVFVAKDRLAVLDFKLSKSGAVEVDFVVELSDVDFARTALCLNSEADRVTLLAADKQPQTAGAMSLHAWVRHDEGTGTLVSRGWDAGEDPVDSGKSGWAVEWRADRHEVVGVRVLSVPDEQGNAISQRFEVAAKAPVSLTWHHIAFLQDDTQLALYIDGALAAEETIDAQPESYDVTAAIRAGGPVHEGPEGGWLDFRLDQVVVWNKVVAPSLDTIYVELTDEARQDVDLVGYWTFDRGVKNDVDVDDDAGYAATYTNAGADVVSQTAPIFPPEKADFEKHLGGMSTDMGLLEVPGWDIRSDPRLFLGADGIVRLYMVARETGESEEVPGGLVYDTTTTRAQFSFAWEAEGDSSVQDGSLILQAHKAGPVMNRAELAMESSRNNLDLTITHPHRPDLEETWRNLPSKLEDLIAVLNGRAGTDPDDDAVRAGDVPLYSYVSDGPQRRNEAYASELVQAVALSIPNNGADALVQAGEAKPRQQGNFTGWTRAPLAVSGRFGDNGHGPVVATVDLNKDRHERLRVPGDFAVESWLRPGSLEASQRVLNWHQVKDDGFSIALEPEPAFAFPVNEDNPERLHVTLADTAGESWFGQSDSDAPDFEGCAFQIGMHVPHSGGEGAEASLLTHATRRETTADLETLFRELRSVAKDQVAKTELDAWWKDITEGDTGRYWDLDEYLAIRVEVNFHVTLEGPLARFGISHDLSIDENLPVESDQEDKEFWIEPITEEKLTRKETRAYIKGKLLPLWKEFSEGKTVDPPKKSDWQLKDEDRKGHKLSQQDPILLAEGTLTAQEGTWVEIDLTLAPSEPGGSSRLLTQSPAPRFNSGTASVYVDGKLAGTAVSEDTWIEAPVAPTSTLFTLGARPDTADPEPFHGAISTVSVWGKALTSEQVAGEDTRPGLVYSVDLSTARAVEDMREVTPLPTPVSLSEVEVIPPVTFPETHFRGLLHLAPTLGERRFRTDSSISTTDWLHVAAVCRDNFALRCSADGHRAIVANADGLEPGTALTIDCVVVPELDGTTNRFIFAKTITLGPDAVTVFRLGIRGDGTPWFRYSANVDGERRVHDVTGHKLESGRAYHLVAVVELKEVFWPDKKASERKKNDTEYQIWVRDEGIWAFDLAKAAWVGVENARPRDFAWSPSFLKVAGITIPRFVHRVLHVATDEDPLYDVRFEEASCPVVIGAGTGEDAAQASTGALGWFRGLIGFVRMFDTRLSATTISATVTSGRLSAAAPKPLAWWKLDENRGLQATDAASGKVARLTDETMWTTSRATARLDVYADGRPVPISPTSSEEVMNYGAPKQLRLGGTVDQNDNLGELFTGEMDEVRIWSDVRTNEEILDGMHSRLGGNERDLAGWWAVCAGAGSRLKDGAGGGNHALLSATDKNALLKFWMDIAAPVGDDLPQVRHLLGGVKTSWTGSSPSTSAMAAEYGDLQEDADGVLKGVQKRALTFGRTLGGAFLTGFKTGDLELTYIGQAQSDPTLIGYIEGAPPVPSENLTRAYYTSAPAYNAYSGNSAVTLLEAENTAYLFQANVDRGIDVSLTAKLLWGFEAEVTVGGGFAFGGFADVEADVAALEGFIGPKTTLDFAWAWQRSASTQIATARTISNKLALGGSWEPAGNVLNDDVGRRYLPDNVGYALVKSGVANIFSLRLRKNGALLGLRMIPDPDIPEDFNILTFRIRPDYTKQGTLDGMIGHLVDPEWPDAVQDRGSYFRPRDVVNLEAEIEAYEARLVASYEGFNAGRHGTRTNETLIENPIFDPRKVVEDFIELPYDWEKNLSKRNIVNTYVWTSSGGLFAEEMQTSIVRTESSGGSFSFKGMVGVATDGKVAAPVGIKWDAEALIGGHIQTTVVKTKSEGRDFGLSVNVDCDDLLERYTGAANQLYSGQPAPGKVQGYRFKSFYLVPDKKHFEFFWSSVVDSDWLESDDADARALRQARSNTNHVWRAFHRVTYVNRVPPASGGPASAQGPKTRSVVHQGPNWQNIKLVLDVMREGKTSTGKSIAGLGNVYEKIAVAVDDVVHNQWGAAAPWWQTVVAGYDADPEGDDAKKFRELRQAAYEYMKAYYDTGLLLQDPRLRQPPLGLPGPDRRPSGGLVALYTFSEPPGDIIDDISQAGSSLSLLMQNREAVRWTDNAMEVIRNTRIVSADPASKITEACVESNEFSVECWVKATRTVNGTNVPVVALCGTRRGRNFEVRQGRGPGRGSRWFEIVFRKSGAGGSIRTTSSISAAEPTHLVFARAAGGGLAVYVNGVLDNDREAGGDLSGWNAEYRLALVDNLKNNRFWRGEYRMVAVYDRALSDAEVRQQFETGRAKWA